MKSDGYRISSVSLAGGSYASFDGASRLLTIPAGVGGFFAVTFAPTTPNSVAGSRENLPVGIRLDQNFPNPFNGSTVIRFLLPVAGTVHLEIYDVLGARIAMPVAGELGAGEHSIVWDGRTSDGRPVASGMYIYRLTASDGVGNQAISTRTMAYMR
jgi:hypothetical protein